MKSAVKLWNRPRRSMPHTIQKTRKRGREDDHNIDIVTRYNLPLTLIYTSITSQDYIHMPHYWVWHGILNSFRKITTTWSCSHYTFLLYNFFIVYSISLVGEMRSRLLHVLYKNIWNPLPWYDWQVILSITIICRHYSIKVLQFGFLIPPRFLWSKFRLIKSHFWLPSHCHALFK